ncbi:MAG: hypothetical protein ISS70_08205 [Phycisphaerae bacterium]|nr:hypothetical protein [Phycisphaerae bacterium]
MKVGTFALIRDFWKLTVLQGGLAYESSWVEIQRKVKGCKHDAHSP